MVHYFFTEFGGIFVGNLVDYRNLGLICQLNKASTSSMIQDMSPKNEALLLNTYKFILVFFSLNVRIFTSYQ